MTDVITFDVELTENQKIAQHKLYQVHKLYDEIEKLLGTQDVFNKPHMLLVLPNKLKKEPMTNEEYLRSCTTEQLAEFLADELNDVVERVLEGVWLNDGDTDRDEYYQRQTDVLEWLKQPHTNE